ncbi:hypothetical protein P8F81_03770 [Kosakonia cowanii]|uniref:hypothetical protein n=1 Tax=Kosakonia cowanii TaxID=208223 RepID=UPI002DDCB194|nr:hypothetical protein [Kosakonia cowanii]WRY60146.1 hypothetical protein P8F81_03770 [Kosakonia cowanii]
MTNNDELALNGYEISNQLRHLADNEIDSDSFAVVTENYNGSEVEFERPITDLALDAAGLIDALLAERDADKKRIAEFQRQEHYRRRQAVIDGLAACGECWDDIKEYMERWDAEADRIKLEVGQ